MSIKRLKARVPSARARCVATLHGHELRFHKKSNDGSGKCDAYETSNPGRVVIGVVFEMAETDKPELDSKEGLGYGYEQKEVLVSVPAGGTIRAVTYYATRIDSELRPYHWYKHHVLTGAKENGLPDEYVEKINDIESLADPDPERHEHEMAIYTNE